MASTSSAIQPPSTQELYYNGDMSPNALIASTIQGLEQQRYPPSMHEILAAFTAKGDGDREMLFALLNAKAAEDNRIAAEKNLRRSLLEICRGQTAPYMSSMHLNESISYPLPSPPTSAYRDLPQSHRRPSLSDSSTHSSDEIYSEAVQHSRKRRRSHSPNHHYHSHRSPESTSPIAPRSDAPLPPSPYSSSSSSQSVTGSPRSREAMTIGSLLSHAHQTHNISYARREDDAGRSRS